MERRKSGMVVTIFVILTVAAIVLVVLLRNRLNRNEGEEMDVSKYADRGITKAYMIPDEDGELEAYDVFVTVPGYKSDIQTKMRIEKDGDKLLELQILSQDETPELGGKIMEGSFLNQFKGKDLPITLAGKKNGAGRSTGEAGSNASGEGQSSNSEGSLVISGTGKAETTQPGQEETTKNAGNESEDTANSHLGEAVQRKDGVYRAEGEEFGGSKSQVTMVIENGEITELLWDAFDADGNGKRALSLQGKYTMTEDGLLWADQADAVQNYVIAHQGLNGLTTNEEGKTDVVSGVSISITSFKELVKDCLAQATGGSGDGAENSAGTDNNSSNGSGNESNGNAGGNGNAGVASEVDGISGATISSAAVVNAVQIAYEFVLEQGNE